MTHQIFSVHFTKERGRFSTDVAGPSARLFLLLFRPRAYTLYGSGWTRTITKPVLRISPLACRRSDFRVYQFRHRSEFLFSYCFDCPNDCPCWHRVWTGDAAMLLPPSTIRCLMPNVAGPWSSDGSDHWHAVDSVFFACHHWLSAFWEMNKCLQTKSSMLHLKHGVLIT